MEWEPWQWGLYGILHYSTAFAYFVMPLCMLSAILFASVRIESVHKDVMVVDKVDTLMRVIFVGSCGFHFLFHPSFLRMGHFWGIVAIDSWVAAVSLIISLRVAIQTRALLRGCNQDSCK